MKLSAGVVALAGVGGIFLWSGFHGASVTGSLRDLLSGQQPSGSNSAPLSAQSGSASTTGPSGDTSAHSASAATNQALGKLLAAPYGWSTGTQWADLVSLWNQESGWSNTATNPTSGAYGIPQALPPTKMPVSAQAPTSSASAQIQWGLSYIKSTYGSPSAAWSHEQSFGWY